MTRKDLLALYGRLGLIMAAFVFVAAIVLGPLVQKMWSPHLSVSEHSGKSIVPQAKPAPEMVADKQG